jgi:hypothetical protein
MKSTDDDGFTFMESLSSIAITLVLSTAVCFLFITLLAARPKGGSSVLSAVQLARTDTLIREKAAEIIIPYWERGTDASAVFTAKLLAEKKLSTTTVVTIENLYDSKKRIRGAAVNYKIAGSPDIFRTCALFGSIPAAGTE